MLEISAPAQLPADFPATAIAIGKFDGLHLGHQQLIHELVQYCQEHSLAPAVLSFDRHPASVLDPDNVPPALIGPAQKAMLLNEAGVEVSLTLTFDSELSSLSAADFCARFLTPLNAQRIFVGEGFRFGSGGQGDAGLLRSLGFQVTEIPSIELGGKRVSSTLIRELLLAGRVDVAAGLLGRNHFVTGVIEHGKKLGRELGFPTANFSRSSQGMLPVDGIYAGYLWANGVRYPAAHSVGTNDSVGEVPRLLESHVIGRDDLDLYDLECTAEFVAQVRPWQHFDSLEILVDQIAKDVLAAEEILGSIDA